MRKKENIIRLTEGMRVHDTKLKRYGVVVSVKEKHHTITHEIFGHVSVKLDGGDFVEGNQYRFNEIVDGIIRLSEVQPFQRSTPYNIDVGLGYLEKTLEGLSDKEIDLNPDFQRGHVWNQEQRERYVEYRLRGGIYGKDIWFNCINWNSGNEGQVQIVDGLQRLTSLRMFLKDEVKAFGQKMSQFHPEDQRMMKLEHNSGLRFHVNNLPTRAHILRWYLDLNAAGTPHSPEEILRVRKLLEDATN